jgi:hypothetical protein
LKDISSKGKCIPVFLEAEAQMGPFLLTKLGKAYERTHPWKSWMGAEELQDRP